MSFGIDSLGTFVGFWCLKQKRFYFIGASKIERLLYNQRKREYTCKYSPKQIVVGSYTACSKWNYFQEGEDHKTYFESKQELEWLQVKFNL